ncbi:MAG: hypothetical protein EBE86_009215 [Hormoscilla sp. GUM202]|nr:hypothetical protein [Hormoscilla sp. GUM202]
MTEIKDNQSTLPPLKNRDPSLTGRSKEELLLRQYSYIRETVKSSARESLRQGKMIPTSVRIGREGKVKLRELQELLGADMKVLLNMAFAYAYNQANRNQVSIKELKSRVEARVQDEENELFEIDENTLNMLFDSRSEDAKFIYLNAGIDLLYFRLVRMETLSDIWQ